MSNSGGIITRPVNQRDIQQVLVISSSINKWSQLCTHANINKWAKYKPVRYAANGIMSQYDFTNEKWKDDSTWWKADGLCGFSTTIGGVFGEPTNSTSWSYKLIHGQLGWTYNKPNGGTYPYRTPDYIKYNHNAEKPYGDIGSTNIYINNSGQAQIDWEIVSVGSDNLQLTDFAFYYNNVNYPLTNMYLGIILWNGSTYYLYTSSNTFGAGGTLSVTMNNAPQGTWNMMPFFTSIQVNSQGGFDAGGVFISMAETSAYSVTLSTTGSNYFGTPYGEWNQAGTSVSYEVDLYNDTGSTHVYSSIRISIRGGSATGTEIGGVNLTNVSVTTHSIRTLTGSVTATKAGYDTYWIVITDNTSGSTIQSKHDQVDDYGGM